MPLYLGVDHADKNDLSCIAMLWPFFRLEDGTLVHKRAVVVHSFAPEHGLIDKVRSWRVPLDAWAREGWLTLLPGDEIDTRVLKAELLKLFENWNVRSGGFDKWFFKQPAAELCEMNLPMVEVPQVPSMLTAPSMALKECIKHAEICGFGQPLLKWTMGNVILEFDEKHGGIRPTKLSKNEKIDPVAAILNSWHRYQAQPITDVDLGERPAISFI
jgi:phage terminase large subunit-like protein